MFYPMTAFQDVEQGQISQISQIPLPLHIDNRTNVPLTADSRMILSLEQQHGNGLRGDAQENQLIKVKCTQCRKRFDSNEEMETHQAKHLTENKFRCEICNKCFPSQSSVWKHTKAHSGERPFVCAICQKAFTQLANLQRHNLVHNGLKPYKCPSCQKAFSQHANMVKHQMLHTGEKPFKCKSCDKAFAQRANLKKHEMIHLGIRPYGCDICLKSYSQQSNLKKHILTHQKKNNKNKNVVPPPAQQPQAPASGNYVIYQCNICKTEIADISDFNKHIKTCNQNPMNSQPQQHQHHLLVNHRNENVHLNGNGQQHNGHNNGIKDNGIEIKTEIDDGSHSLPGPQLILAQNHHQVPQQQYAHHQIPQLLTTNGHIITNFLELSNHHQLHIDYSKH